MSFFRTKILGTGMCYPQRVFSNDDFAKIIDTSDEWITERTGIKRRRFASLEGGEFPSDLAKGATEEALQNANLKPNDIDLIIFATITPDYRLPSCATILQTKLGITNQCAAVDIVAACSGFIYGVTMAHSMIQTGLIKRALVVGAEMLSREINLEDRASCILFGDGCGVAIIGRNEDANDPSEILTTKIGADGTGREFFQQEYGGSANPFTPEVLQTSARFMAMQGKEMFRVAVRTLTDISTSALEAANLKISDIHWFVPHQANIRIIEATGNRLGVPAEKVIININEYANTSAATVPTAFHGAVKAGQIKRGDLVLMSAFGAGLTAGSLVVRY
ncbi:MAG: ketoacyl-ACP synthase III [Oligoflexia bacterium]|nr:ketoacyl-ACP synthase III [Oligoflexia bacterium]MBF0364471.1 ketoacyl-ACP synthase III [Oligoflexia bacterium]